MSEFRQKYSLIAFLEPVAEGFDFFWKDYPLHITLAAVFAVNWNDANRLDLADLIRSTSVVELVAGKDVHWGEEGQNHVVLMEKSEEIMKLHTDIHELLLRSGAVFNEPQFEGDGYAPHVTVQKHARLYTDDTAKITSLCIVDMFPGGDGYQRKVMVKTDFSG